LPLNDDERYAFLGELDGVCVAQLVRGEAAPDAGGRRGVAQLCEPLRSTSVGRASGR
jgi:hypothetical protein